MISVEDVREKNTWHKPFGPKNSSRLHGRSQPPSEDRQRTSQKTLAMHRDNSTSGGSSDRNDGDDSEEGKTSFVIAAKEHFAVLSTKALVFVTLALSATTLGLTAYLLVSEEEARDFRNQVSASWLHLVPIHLSNQNAGARPNSKLFLSFYTVP